MVRERTILGTVSGIRPIELLALGLAGCTGMDVISILRKKRPGRDRFRGARPRRAGGGAPDNTHIREHRIPGDRPRRRPYGRRAGH
jgi:hypothetical protein